MTGVLSVFLPSEVTTNGSISKDVRVTVNKLVILDLFFLYTREHTIPFRRKISDSNNFHKHDSLHTVADTRELIRSGRQSLALQTPETEPSPPLFSNFRFISIISRLIFSIDVVQILRGSLGKVVFLLAKTNEILEFPIYIVGRCNRIRSIDQREL